MTINLTTDIGKNFCYAPWTNIHVNPQGFYKTCCGGSELDNLREVSIDQALQNTKLLEIKQSLLNNQPHDYCKSCVESEKHSSWSERKWYSDIAERKIIPIKKIEDQVIQNLDIRWSIACNLSCSYCAKGASSVWAQLEGEPLERMDYGQNLSKLMDFIIQNKSTIKNLGLLGGEPLLQKENEVLLTEIGNNVHINVITNLSVPLEKNKIFNRLIEMDNVMWDISFETIGDRFEYVRHGAKWTNMLNNIDILKRATANKPGHNIGITGQFCVYNCLNLSEVFEALRDYNLPDMRLSELTYPHILSVFSLPNHLMKIAADKAIKSIPYATKPIQQFLQNQHDNLLAVPDRYVDIEELYTHHRDQENKYWPNFELKFEKLWPEFKTL